MNNNVFSVYIHIPFCKKLCSYCNFSKIYYQEELVNMYLDTLEKEIKEKMWTNEIRTLYIGGGTPSSLSMSNLKKLFSITNQFKYLDNYEFSFECNLDDIREELLKVLKENKVNRLSIGIQSFNKNKLKLMDRDATFKDAFHKINLCRKMGFDNISVDLIYGFEKESVAHLKKDLKLITKLKPDHISTYSLIIEPNTVLKINNVNPIDDSIDSDMYKTIVKFLKKRKYNHYEISNFSKKNKESLHNLTYWNNNEYYGFGLSASGYLDGVRYTNTKNIKSYLKKEFTLEKEILSKQEIMEYEVILGLRKIKGINKKDFQNKFNENLNDVFKIDSLIEEKHLTQKDEYIFINPKKIYLMNEILLKLLP